MFRRLARIGRQYWQLLVLLLVIALSITAHYTLSPTVEHWWLGTISLLLIIPAIVRDWARLHSEAVATNALGYITVLLAVGLHQYTIALAAASVLIVTEYVGNLLIARRDRRFTNATAVSTAHILRGRKVIDIASELVQPGDKLVVNHGETIPVDAVILEGSSEFTENGFDGSQNIVTKSKGDTLLAGAINNGEPVTIRAAQTAAHSQYVSFTKILRTALEQKSPFVRRAARFSLAFTILALVIAGGAWYISGESIRALDVLVASTVFPLLVSVPVTFLYGMLRVGNQGLVLRSSSAFEDVANIQTIAFDVAGILTNDTMQVDGVTALRSHTKDEILTIAASILQSSHSQLATTITEYSKDQGTKIGRLKHIKQLPGNGLQATFRGKSVTVGSLETLQHANIDTASYDKHAKGLHLYIAIGSALAGYITFSDALRPEVATEFTWLHKHHINTMLLSEHSSSYVDALRGKLTFNQSLTGLSRADKLHAISAATERPLAYIGNTSSDSQALTAADIGIALGVDGMPADAGSAQVLTASTKLSSIIDGITVAKKTLLTAKLVIALGLSLSLASMLVLAFGTLPTLVGFGAQLAINTITVLLAYWLSRRN